MSRPRSTQDRPPGTTRHRLSREGDWEAMGALIDDDVLATFAVVASVDKVPAAVRTRCAGVMDRVLPAFPPGLPGQVVAEVLDGLRREVSPATQR